MDEGYKELLSNCGKLANLFLLLVSHGNILISNDVWLKNINCCQHLLERRKDGLSRRMRLEIGGVFKIRDKLTGVVILYIQAVFVK